MKRVRAIFQIRSRIGKAAQGPRLETDSMADVLKHGTNVRMLCLCSEQQVLDGP